MKRIYVLLIALLCSSLAFSQNTFKAIVKNGKTGGNLAGTMAVLKGTSIVGFTDTAGLLTLANVPNGIQVLEFSKNGYITRIDTLSFPITAIEPMAIILTPLNDPEEQEDKEGEELTEVKVVATRSSRTIANIPTRVEVISGEELDEKANMKPGDIRMLLAETTGIQTQQTSATSANASIRIQGLDGKYTQIIRDGFPLYAGFSGGLGLLQIAPLDLQQVEVIKGSSSTLYGAGAIAGLVNLVSKQPTEERQIDFLLNGTSALGLDASMFYAEKTEKIGTTVYAAYNHGSAYDPSDLDLTAIPKFDRFTFNPKLYIYFNEQTTLDLAINSTLEKRIGGDMHFIKGEGTAEHSYFEENKTGRFSFLSQLDHKISERERLTLRGSISYFNRSIGLPDYRFSGAQVSSYSEANYNRSGDHSDWVLGLNFITDNFNEDHQQNFPLRNYSYNTIGGFVQNTLDLSRNITLESGLRGDYHNEYGFFLLPRLSGLFKLSNAFSMRLGGGLGYKAPTVFTEDAERIQFRDVYPILDVNSKAERSYGANYDLNYRTALFDNQVGFSINQLFFYTRIDNPLQLIEIPNGGYQFLQPDGDINTKGFETNLKLTYRDFKLFVGYTFADVDQHSGNQVSSYPLVSRHRLNNVLMYEVEDKWKIGAEAYYFSRQLLNDGAIGESYWTTGLLVEKIWERFSVFINFENFTDTRQAKFGSIYTGTITNPVFRDIYAPMDGFVMNGGIKLRL